MNNIFEILRENKITSLWHFTDIENLSSIKKQGGLLSKEKLENLGILSQVRRADCQISRNQDKKLGNWNKVNLYFTPHTPMAYRIKRKSHLVFIEIDPLVATLDCVYFSNINAASNESIKECGLSGIKKIRFDIINGDIKPKDPEWKKHVQAEILIPDYIEMKYFMNIIFVSEASKKMGEFYWEGSSPLFKVDKRPFFDLNNEKDKMQIMFPYIEKIELIGKEKISNSTRRIDNNIIRAKYKCLNAYLLFRNRKMKRNSQPNGNSYKFIIRSEDNRVIKQCEKTITEEKKYRWKIPIKMCEIDGNNRRLFIECMINECIWYKNYINLICESLVTI